MIEAPHTESASLVIDNLLLQQVGETLRLGLTDDQRVEIAASGEHGYEVRPVPSAGVQVEELLQFLNAIILTDELIVDAASTSSWEDVASHFEPATEARLLIKKPFSEVRNEWLPIRKLAEEALSFSPQLSADFAEFRANWKPGVNDPVFSTLILLSKPSSFALGLIVRSVLRLGCSSGGVCRWPAVLPRLLQRIRCWT